jgi:hypothetical protein
MAAMAGPRLYETKPPQRNIQHKTTTKNNKTTQWKLWRICTHVAPSRRKDTTTIANYSATTDDSIYVDL